MRYLMICLTVLLALAFNTTAWAATPVSAANPRGEFYTGKVDSISGPGTDALYIYKGKKQTLRKGAAIKGGHGAQIKSGANTIELTLGDLTHATVEPYSDITIRSLYFSRWNDQVVLQVDEGAIEITNGTGIAHKAIAAIFTDRLQADISEGQARVGKYGDRSIVSVTTNEVAVKSAASGLTEYVNSGYTKTIDAGGERTGASGLRRFISLKTALWLLIPLALLYRRRASQRAPKYQGRRGRKIRPETA